MCLSLREDASGAAVERDRPTHMTERERQRRNEWREHDEEERGARGVGGSSSDRALLHLSQIISALEVRKGKMSKYLNTFHGSMSCSQREMLGSSGVERERVVQWMKWDFILL